MFPECIFENSLENLRKKLVFWEIPWMLYFVCQRSIEFFVDSSFIDFLIYFFLYYSLFFYSVCECYYLMPDIWRYCLFLTFQLDKIDAYIKRILRGVYNLPHLFVSSKWWAFSMDGWMDDGWIHGWIVCVCFEVPGIGCRLQLLLPNCLAFSRLMI